MGQCLVLRTAVIAVHPCSLAAPARAPCGISGVKVTSGKHTVGVVVAECKVELEGPSQGKNWLSRAPSRVLAVPLAAPGSWFIYHSEKAASRLCEEAKERDERVKGFASGNLWNRHKPAQPRVPPFHCRNAFLCRTR